MPKKRPPDFDLDLSEPPVDRMYQNELEENRIDRLGQRMTLIAILIPLLIAVAVAIAYMDIRKKLEMFDSSGNLKVQSLSENLKSSFSSLSVDVAQLEESLNTRYKALEKSAAELSTKLEKLEKIDKSLRTGKVDKDTLNTEIDRIETAVSVIQKDLDAVASGMQRLKGIQDTELKRMSESLTEATGDLQTLESTVNDLALLRTDVKMLELTIKNERKTFEAQLEKTVKDLTAKMAALEASSDATPAPDTPAPPPAETPKAETPPPPPPEQIEEQTIE